MMLASLLLLLLHATSCAHATPPPDLAAANLKRVIDPTKDPNDDRFIGPFRPQGSKIEFSILPGYIQGMPLTMKMEKRLPRSYPEFDRRAANLGLVKRDYEGVDAKSIPKDKPWQRLVAHVKYLNEKAPEGTKYKIVYFTRHGEGWHNYLHHRYPNQWMGLGTYSGKKPWLEKSNSDEIKDWRHFDQPWLSWFDAELTPQGIAQCEGSHKQLVKMQSDAGLPMPARVYVSPLIRAVETAYMIMNTPKDTASTSSGTAGTGTEFVVKEKLREVYSRGVKENERHPVSWLKQRRPELRFEDGMREEDPFAQKRLWESPEHCRKRCMEVMEDIWEDSGDEQLVSLVFHGYLADKCQQLGAERGYALKNAQTIPMVVMGVKK